MELTPEDIVDQIKQLLPESADFEDSEGNLILGSPIPWLIIRIREYGEQQREKTYQEAYQEGYKDGLKRKQRI